MSLFGMFKSNNKVSKEKDAYSGRKMTFDEANDIFDTWCKWFWPNGAILQIVFPGSKPESLLPDKANKIDEALDIMWDYYDHTPFYRPVINGHFC